MASDQITASDLLDFDTTYQLAQQGDPIAQNNLGYFYNHGMGVPEDYAQARYWYEKSAQQGFVEAQFHLTEL